MIATNTEPTETFEIANGLTFALAGAGGRGNMFAEWLRSNVCAGAITAIAEPNSERLRSIAEMHQIPKERQFRSFQ